MPTWAHVLRKAGYTTSISGRMHYACDGTRVPMRMIRRGRWKAWFALDLPPLLFDLEDDPHEWNDLSGEDSARHILEDLYGLACSSG